MTSRSEEEHPENSGSTFTVSIPLGSAHLPASLVHETEKPNPHGLASNELE